MSDQVDPPTNRPKPSYVLVPLAPAILWIVYFMVVYLYAEAACVFGWDQPSWFGLHGVSAVTVLVTVGATGAVTYYSVRSWQMFRGSHGSRDEQMSRSLGLLGVISGFVFVVATIAVGLPAILHSPC